MKRLKPFAYFEPTTLAGAVEILSQKGKEAYPLAGGTDLLVRMKEGEIKPSALVNLKRIDGLARIGSGSDPRNEDCGRGALWNGDTKKSCQGFLLTLQ